MYFIIFTTLLFLFSCTQECKEKTSPQRIIQNYDQNLILVEQGYLGSTANEDSLFVSYIDSTGQVVFPFQWDSGLDFEQNQARVEWNDHWGIINTKGEWIVNPVYEDLGILSEGMRKFQFNQKWGYLDQYGVVVIPAQFNQAQDFSENRAGVCYGKHCVFINQRGQILWNDSFESTTSFYHNLAWVKKNQKWYRINSLGQIQTKQKFDDVIISTDTIQAVKDKLWGFVDLNGNWILPCQYEEVHSFSEGLAAVRQGDQWGYMNLHGEWVIQPQFEEVGDFKHQISWYKKGEYLGLLHIKGQILSQAKYLSVDFLKNGYVKTWSLKNDSTYIYEIFNPNLKRIYTGFLIQKAKTILDTSESIAIDTLNYSSQITPSIPISAKVLKLNQMKRFHTQRKILEVQVIDSLKDLPELEELNSSTQDELLELPPTGTEE